MNLPSLPMVPVQGGLSRYLDQIKQFPVLDRDEEYMLAQRFQEHGDKEAAHKLVTSHLRLVAKIAFGYRGYGLPMSDLISEGNLGLMKAVRKFDPEKGFRLSTYAMWWIKASVTEFILQSWSLVKLGTVAAQKKLFFSLRKIKSRLGIFGDAQLTGPQVKQLSGDLSLPEREVVNMDQRLSARDMSLNAPLPSEDGGEYMDLLADERETPESILVRSGESAWQSEVLREAMETLPERDRHIIEMRKLSDDPMKLEELGEHYGVSRERIRQIEARAFEKIAKFVREAAEERGYVGAV